MVFTNSMVVDFATGGRLYLVLALPKLENFQILEVSDLDVLKFVIEVCASLITASVSLIEFYVFQLLNLLHKDF